MCSSSFFAKISLIGAVGFVAKLFSGDSNLTAVFMAAVDIAAAATAAAATASYS